MQQQQPLGASGGLCDYADTLMSNFLGRIWRSWDSSCSVRLYCGLSFIVFFPCVLSIDISAWFLVGYFHGVWFQGHEAGCTLHIESGGASSPEASTFSRNRSNLWRCLKCEASTSRIHGYRWQPTTLVVFWVYQWLINHHPRFISNLNQLWEGSAFKTSNDEIHRIASAASFQETILGAHSALLAGVSPVPQLDASPIFCIFGSPWDLCVWDCFCNQKYQNQKHMHFQS